MQTFAAYIRADKHNVQTIPYTFALVFLVSLRIKKSIHHPNSLYTQYCSMHTASTCRKKTLCKTRNQAAVSGMLSLQYEQFYSYFKSLCSLCVSQQCVCLATGFLTLQVQLPVLRPHLRRGITAYYSSTNNSLCPPTCRQPDTGNRGRCERCYISTWMCEQQASDLLPVTDTLPAKLIRLL